MELSNPFNPGKWGKTYKEVAGWTPEPCDGVIIIPAYDAPGEFIAGIPYVGSDEIDFPSIRKHPPLLPSPEWINAQDNPREVAIAALERAWQVGQFIQADDETREGCYHLTLMRGEEYHQVAFMVLKPFPTVTHPTTPEAVDARLARFYAMDIGDPVLARCASDCFTVLKPWADAINWGGAE